MHRQPLFFFIIISSCLAAAQIYSGLFFPPPRPCGWWAVLCCAVCPFSDSEFSFSRNSVDWNWLVGCRRKKRKNTIFFYEKLPALSLSLPLHMIFGPTLPAAANTYRFLNQLAPSPLTKRLIPPLPLAHPFYEFVYMQYVKALD